MKSHKVGAKDTELRLNNRVYLEKDVKEFIKKLKEELGAKSYETYLRVDAQGNINEGIIDKLAGEELI
jgi:hypothetical protein